MMTPNETIKVRGGRTGRMIHYGYVGSSVLACGKWVKFDLRHFRVSNDTPVTCEICKHKVERRENDLAPEAAKTWGMH